MTTFIATSRGDSVPINIDNQVFFNGKFIDVPDHSPEALFQQFVVLIHSIGSTIDFVKKQFSDGADSQSREYLQALQSGKINTFQFCALLLMYNKCLKVESTGEVI